MTKTIRQTTILKMLQDSSEPISANHLAKLNNVSRQLIVGDIALLRASGHNITASHLGYTLNPTHLRHSKQLVFKHTPEMTRMELEILVKHHCHVVDVIIEHPSYGAITGELNIKTMDDVDAFMNQHNPLISILTDGVHIHTIEYDDPKNLSEAITELTAHQLLYT